MKILYVTPLWKGLESLLYKGSTQPKGVPGFFEPLKRLLMDGHSVDIAIVGSKTNALKIGPGWLKKSTVFWVNQRSAVKLISLLRIIRHGNYDFIYGHGGAAGWGNLAAMLARKPCGVRMYGTFLGRYLHKSWLQIFRSGPLEVLTHNLPKKFMIITNDGTKGDLVHYKCCIYKNFYDFYFPLNGVEKALKSKKYARSYHDLLADYGLNPQHPFLLYPARYDAWKRQDMAIDIIASCQKSNNIQLLFCGFIGDALFHQSLIERVQTENLSDRIVFSGAVCKEDLQVLMKNALAVISLYDFSNFGNVLIEAAMEGAVIITRNDGSTNILIRDGENGFQISSPEHGAEVVQQLLNDSQYRIKISREIQKDALKIFTTWKDRSCWEINLIQKAVQR